MKRKIHVNAYLTLLSCFFICSVCSFIPYHFVQTKEIVNNAEDSQRKIKS